MSRPFTWNLASVSNLVIAEQFKLKICWDQFLSSCLYILSGCDSPDKFLLNIVFPALRQSPLRRWQQGCLPWLTGILPRSYFPAMGRGAYYLGPYAAQTIQMVLFTMCSTHTSWRSFQVSENTDKTDGNLGSTWHWLYMAMVAFPLSEEEDNWRETLSLMYSICKVLGLPKSFSDLDWD